MPNKNINSTLKIDFIENELPYVYQITEMDSLGSHLLIPTGLGIQGAKSKVGPGTEFTHSVWCDHHLPVAAQSHIIFT